MPTSFNSITTGNRKTFAYTMLQAHVEKFCGCLKDYAFDFDSFQSAIGGSGNLLDPKHRDILFQGLKDYWKCL